MPGPRGRAPTSSAISASLNADLGVAAAGHAGEQRKGAVLELHHHALERGLRLVDRQLEQLQMHRLVASEHVAVGDPEQQAIADLAGGAGHRDADGLFHRELQDDGLVREACRHPGTPRAGKPPSAWRVPAGKFYGLWPPGVN